MLPQNPDEKGELVKQGSGFPWAWQVTYILFAVAHAVGLPLTITPTLLQERLFILKGSGLYYFKAPPPTLIVSQESM